MGRAARADISEEFDEGVARHEGLGLVSCVFVEHYIDGVVDSALCHAATAFCLYCF